MFYTGGLLFASRICWFPLNHFFVLPMKSFQFHWLQHNTKSWWITVEQVFFSCNLPPFLLQTWLRSLQTEFILSSCTIPLALPSDCKQALIPTGKSQSDTSVKVIWGSLKCALFHIHRYILLGMAEFMFLLFTVIYYTYLHMQYFFNVAFLSTVATHMFTFLCQCQLSIPAKGFHKIIVASLYCNVR